MSKALNIALRRSGVLSHIEKSSGAVQPPLLGVSCIKALSSNVLTPRENGLPYFFPMEHHKTNNGKYIF